MIRRVKTACQAEFGKGVALGAPFAPSARFATGLFAPACLAAALLAFSLAGCASSPAASESSSAAAESTAAADTSNQARDLLEQAAKNSYENLSFSTNSSTKTNYGSNTVGYTMQQSSTLKLAGQLERTSKAKRLHMTLNLESTQSDPVALEIFLNNDDMVVVEDGTNYGGKASDVGFDGYYTSVTRLIDEDGVSRILDAANKLELKEASSDGSRVVMATLAADKLDEMGMLDSSTLPEGSTPTSMVASYTITANNRISKVVLTGGATGDTSYHIRQTSTFSDYDEAEFPETPEVSLASSDNGLSIQTDENGNQYIVGPDGTVYNIDHIEDDGTIYYSSGANEVVSAPDGQTVQRKRVKVSNSTTSGSQATGPKEKPAASSSARVTEGSSSSATASSSSSAVSAGATESTAASESTAAPSSSASSASSGDSKGRAYITDDGGKIHYLDEEGSRLITNSDGTRYFIDADGNFYYLGSQDI